MSRPLAAPQSRHCFASKDCIKFNRLSNTICLKIDNYRSIHDDDTLLGSTCAGDNVSLSRHCSAIESVTPLPSLIKANAVHMTLTQLISDCPSGMEEHPSTTVEN